jgi:hypothetical protein
MYRVDEANHEGNVRRILRKEVLGSTQEFKTRKLAQCELGRRLERINSFSYRPGRTATLAQFVESYRENVLTLRKPSSSKAPDYTKRLGKTLAEVATSFGRSSVNAIERFKGSPASPDPKQVFRTVVSELTWGLTCPCKPLGDANAHKRTITPGTRTSLVLQVTVG